MKKTNEKYSKPQIDIDDVKKCTAYARAVMKQKISDKQLAINAMILAKYMTHDYLNELKNIKLILNHCEKSANRTLKNLNKDITKYQASLK